MAAGGFKRWIKQLETGNGAIKFNDDGFLDVELVKEAAQGMAVNSNLAVLSRLAENDFTIQVMVDDEYSYQQAGTTKTEAFGDEHYFTNFTGRPDGGVTVPPSVDPKFKAAKGVDNGTSGTGGFMVYINSQQVEGTTKTRGQAVAHEMVHVSRFLKALMGNATGWWHGDAVTDTDVGTDKATENAEREASPVIDGPKE